jgi:hypothetical protein
MVKGLDIFRDRFRQFDGSFVMIGGAACDEWFTNQGLIFRATRDLDIVLLIEVLNKDFVAAMRNFVAEGGYEIRQRSEGVPILYRFAKPTQDAFPYMLELFSRLPDGLELAEGQQTIPVGSQQDQHSLSAILLDDVYYNLIRTHSQQSGGLRVAGATALIPLKAHAWSDLTRRRSAGEAVDSKNVDKHRSDVFRLAATLPGGVGPDIPPSIKADLSTFLSAFPETSPDWQAILAALKNTIPGTLRPSALRLAIQTYFQLSIS